MKNHKSSLTHKLLALALSFAVAASWMIPSVSVYAAEGDGAQQPAVTEGETTEVQPVVMSSVSVGGVNYYFANTEGQAEDTVYQAVVRSRIGSTTFEFKKADMTKLGDTEYYYTTVNGAAPLEGTLYGYVPGTGTARSYKDIYAEVGASAEGDSYDAVTSATHFTSHHAGDIPSVVTFGADAEGNKVISGVTLGRETTSVDAVSYVEASILNAAGEALTEEQNALLGGIELKANPANAPKEKVAAKIGSVEHAASKYGAEVFNVYPDDTVDGYVWNEYLDSIYAATISDGTTTVGAVHWIDIYGESAATPGYHYNKVEFELNNGTVPEANPNKATVNRYAAFFNEDNKVKDGTYTIKIYAEGYDTVEATIDYVSTETKVQKAKAAAAKITSANYLAESVTAVQAALKALDEAIAGGEAAAIEEAAGAVDTAVAAAKAKAKATIKVSPLKKNLKAKTLKKKTQKFKLKAKVSSKAKASFKKTSGNKKIKVSKTGKVTVKKGLKKGTYKVKVKVTAPTTSKAKAAKKTVTVVIKVK